MIGLKDIANLTSIFGIDDYRACLAARHANLERDIQAEWGRPAPDQLWLTALKRRRLRVKEEIIRLHPSSPLQRTASHA
ncbi:MAG: DUF465 domain-containing protein [Alphaproteobacteria bacterium]|nr:DUF465 domain-containing protein [Alphaproteobacteria bacterium]